MTSTPAPARRYRWTILSAGVVAQAANSAILLGLPAIAPALRRHYGLTLPRGAVPGIKGGFLGAVLHTYPSEMALNFWTALFAWTGCFVATLVISLVTTRNKTDEELVGLVYSLTPRLKEDYLPWYKRPVILAVFVLVGSTILNVIFW